MRMSSSRFLITVIVVFLAATASGYGADTAATQQKTPIAHFPVSHYRFDTVVDGTDVVYDFVIQNKGSAPLDVENVRTG